MTRNLDQQLSRLHLDKEIHTSRRKRFRGSWLLGAVVLAAAGLGAYWKFNAPIEVKTARIEQEAVQSGTGPALVTASGYIVPRHKVEVSPKIIGVIKEAFVKRGDRVKKGDVLLKIDDEEYQARLAASEAQVASLKAKLAELRAGARPEEIDVAEAQAASAEANLSDAERVLKEMQASNDFGISAKDELDRARTARDVAKARRDAERKNVALIRKGPRKEQIEAAEAQLREAEANVEVIKTELGYTVIRAPIDGTILEKLAEQGELVTNTNFGGTRGAKSSVVSMADLTDLQVEVEINETDLAKVKTPSEGAPHQKTEIRLDSTPQHVYSGEVDEVSPQADRQKGTVQVKVRVIDPDDSMKTEVSAHVTFLGDATESGRDARPVRLWIPRAAIIPGKEPPAEGDRSQVELGNERPAEVYILENGKASRREITLGADAERGVEVTKGLSGTECLILSPLEKLSAGTNVKAAQQE